jgi:hypothetical protein
VKTVLRSFVDLLEVELVPAGFVRRGPVFRYFAPSGNAIVLDIQRSSSPTGDVDFFINVGLLLAPHAAFFLGELDPRLDAMPMHGIWEHRLVANTATGALPDHRFTLTADADTVSAAAAVVRTWLSDNLPALMSWLDIDAMLAAADQHRRRSDLASIEQISDGQWKPGRWPEGHWNSGVLRAYAHAENGDPDAAATEIAGWHTAGPGSIAEDVMALAVRRAAERNE